MAAAAAATSAASSFSKEMHNLQQLNDVLKSFGSVRLEQLTDRYVFVGGEEEARINDGSFGVCYRVRPALTGVRAADGTPMPDLSQNIVAAKILEKSKITKKTEHIAHFAAELAVTGLFTHPHLNRRLGLYHNAATIFLILELCGGPRPDVQTRVAWLLSHSRQPQRLMMIDAILSGWREAARAAGVEADREEAFSDYVDERKLMQGLCAQVRVDPKLFKKEMLGGGDVHDLILGRGRLPEPLAKVICRQVLDAFQHLHLLHLVHRDLRSENVGYTLIRCSELVREQSTNKVTGVIFYEKVISSILDFGMVSFVLRANAPGYIGSPGGYLAATSSSSSASKNELAPPVAPPPLSGALEEPNVKQQQQQQQQQQSVGAGGGTVGSCPQFPSCTRIPLNSTESLDQQYGDADEGEDDGGYDPFKNVDADGMATLQESNDKASKTGFDQITLSPGIGNEIFRSFEAIRGQLESTDAKQRWLSSLATAPKVDCFAIGALTFYCLMGKAPFVVPRSKGTEGRMLMLLELMKEGPRFDPKVPLSPDAQTFIKKMLSIDHSVRPTAHQALLHEPFLKGVDDKNVIRTEVSCTGAARVSLMQEFPPHIALTLLKDIAASKRNDFPQQHVRSLLQAAFPPPSPSMMRVGSSCSSESFDVNERSGDETSSNASGSGSGSGSGIADKKKELVSHECDALRVVRQQHGEDAG